MPDPLRMDPQPRWPKGKLAPIKIVPWVPYRQDGEGTRHPIPDGYEVAEKIDGEWFWT